MDHKSTKIKYYSSVNTQEIEWLWYPYIPYGRITVIQGDPGEGKTTFVLQITARLSTGQLLPECNKALPPQNAIYQSTEDGIADTVKPRLINAAADCDRIAFIDDTTYPLTLDDERLEHAIKECQARLLVLDPLQAFISANSDMHRANEMRPLMNKLAGIAERTRCAIIIIGHMNKTIGTKGLYRSLGSIDITAAARSVLMIGRLKDDPSIRVMTHLKSNLAPEGRSIAFEMIPEGGFHWIGYYDVTTDDLLTGNTQQDDSKLLQARTLLKEVLSEKPMLCADAYALCKKYNIGERTADSAKRLENIKSIKMPDGWYWKFEVDIL
ncbi:MAG: AAA family ATPase [Oscillospiraceae bacterium]|nr:AAA family ATPase [Oscillospiraceae bacterium]